MRNLAKLLLARGIGVSGSDLKDSKGLGELRDAGRRRRGRAHDPAHVGDHDPDAVVVSSAIGDATWSSRGPRVAGSAVWARAQALAALTSGTAWIAVAGTHGKTTTTRWWPWSWNERASTRASSIGGDLNESRQRRALGRRASSSSSKPTRATARSCWLPHPIGIVTNVDVDHVDFYPGGRDEIESAFAEFMTRCEVVVACGDDPGVAAALVARGRASASPTGTDPANDVRVVDRAVGPGGARGTVAGPDGRPVPLTLQVRRRAQPPERRRRRWRPPRRWGSNRLPAAEALAAFAGVRRRFELRGNVRGADFYRRLRPRPVELAVTLGVAARGATRPADGRVPAPPVLADAGALARAGREPDRGGPRGGDRCLRRRPGTDPRRDRQARRRRRAEASPATRVVYLPHRHDVVRFLGRRGARGRPGRDDGLRRRLDARRRGARADPGGGR